MACDASTDIATRFIGEIERSFEPLRHFPLSGAGREHLAPGLRVTFHSPYAVVYVVRQEAVVILRVVHGARDIAAVAERGGFS